MHSRKLVAVIILGALYGLGGLGLATASTIQDFDNPGTAYLLTNFYGPAASVQSGGPTGNYLRLAYANSGNTLNTVAFDRTDTGKPQQIVANFDFRMGEGSRADGIGFALLNTTVYGTSGAGPGISEEVNLTKSLGIGFDTYDNSEVGGNNHLSLHWNGALLSNFALNPSTQLDLGNDLFNHAQVVVDFLSKEVTVTLTPNGGTAFTPIDHYFIADLASYDSRVAFGARTGGATNNHDLDNINVQFNAVPLPPSMLFFSSGLIGLVGWRRFRKS
jgi:hypothetical protein